MQDLVLLGLRLLDGLLAGRRLSFLRSRGTGAQDHQGGNRDQFPHGLNIARTVGCEIATGPEWPSRLAMV